MATRDEALAAVKRLQESAQEHDKSFSSDAAATFDTDKDAALVLDYLMSIPEPVATIEQPRWRCAQCRERYEDPETHVCHGFKSWEDDYDQGDL
jgi:hypothetical protein